MDDLVAAGAEDRRAQDLLALGVDDDLHEALRLALLDRSLHLRHGALADEDLLAGRLRRGLRHPGPAERRLDEERVGLDAVGHPPGVVVQEIRGHDLEVVVGRVRERAPPIAVAERPDALDVRAELVVDDDVAPRVRFHAGAVQPQIVRVGDPADGEEQMRAVDLGRALLAVDARPHARRTLLESDALRVRAHRDPLVLEDAPDRLGDVLVLAPDQPRRHLDHRDLASEPPIHLGELEADVAAADDDEVRRHEVDVHDRGVRPERDRIQAFDGGGRGGPAADVDEDASRPRGPRRRRGPRGANRTSRGPGERARSRGRAATPRCRRASVAGDRVLAGLDLLHVDRDRAVERHPELRGPLRGAARRPRSRRASSWGCSRC